MSIYSGMLLELLSIECDSKNPHIIIRLKFDETVDIKWEIDLETANQLKALIEPEKGYKYRLSFQSMPIPAKGSYYSWITKTHGDKSDNIFFPCSNAYVDGLKFIKACTSLRDLVKDSAFTALSPYKKKVKKTLSSNALVKWARLSVAVCVSLIFILVYSGRSFDYELAFAKKTSVHHKVSHQTMLTIKPINNKTARHEKDAITKAASELIPSFSINKLISSSVPEGSVALTFDDGPSKYTKDIVDILKNKHAGGTFFFIGQNVKKFPTMVQYVNTNGYSIGNHSMHHPDLTELSSQEQQLEITETNQLIEKLISKPVTLFRPPYEAQNQSTINLVQEDHLKMVLWDRDPRDWQTKDPRKILNYVETNDSSGTIILLHESQKVIDILPSIINYLKSQHLQMVTLEGDKGTSHL